jgi:hypothetical protein
MISKVQFGGQAMTANKQAMPESIKFDGPASVEVSSAQNSMAANSNKPLPKPGFSS